MQPHASPDQIVLDFGPGADLSLTPKGDLVIVMGTSEFRLHAPIIRQQTKLVAGQYLVKSNRTVTFSLGPYDKSKPLVIDPFVTYSSYVGGSDDEGIFGIHRDKSGNIYVAGETSSLNFPTERPFQAQGGGNYDAFVSEFDPTGKKLIFSTYLGGSNYDHAVGLVLAANDDVLVAGETSSTDFPTYKALQATLAGSQNAFIARLQHSGSELVFSTYLGGSEYDYPQDLATDPHSNIYITGSTSSADYPVTPGAFQTQCAAPNGQTPIFCGQNGFISKLNSDGSKLVYSTFLGGSWFDGANGIAVDEAGAALITGNAGSADFPVLRALQPKLAGFSNAFLTKLNPSGDALAFSTYLGGSNSDGATAIALGPDHEIYLTGTTVSTDFPLVHPFQETNKGGFSDGFLAKLSQDGQTLLDSSYFGGSGWDYPFKVSVDDFGCVSVIGFTSSTDLAVLDAVQPSYAGGNTDAFALKLLPVTFSPLYATYFGGTGDEFGYGILSEKYGALWFSGSTSSTDFHTAEAFQSTYQGGPYDAFLTRFQPTTSDYLRILKDLLYGEESSWLTDAQWQVEQNNTRAVIADLEQLDLTLNQRPESQRALVASQWIQQFLKQTR